MKKINKTIRHTPTEKPKSATATRVRARESDTGLGTTNVYVRLHSSTGLPLGLGKRDGGVGGWDGGCLVKNKIKKKKNALLLLPFLPNPGHFCTGFVHFPATVW